MTMGYGALIFCSVLWCQTFVLEVFGYDNRLIHGKLTTKNDKINKTYTLPSGLTDLLKLHAEGNLLWVTVRCSPKRVPNETWTVTINIQNIMIDRHYNCFVWA